MEFTDTTNLWSIRYLSKIGERWEIEAILRPHANFYSGQGRERIS